MIEVLLIVGVIGVLVYLYFRIYRKQEEPEGDYVWVGPGKNPLSEEEEEKGEIDDFPE